MENWSDENLYQIRRKLHQIPEIGLEEFETHNYLMEIIRTLPAEKLEITEWKTAILVRVKGYDSKKTMAWRTDIDGLPVVEKTGLACHSLHEGRMHACGHDIHMTVALGLLQRLTLAHLKNDVVFIFQPAEENEAGGKLMYDAGVLNEWMPDEIYALHVKPNLPVGSVSTRVGTLFAGTCEINAKFIGKSGHAAYPYLAKDMIVAAADFVQQMQTIVSRNVDPTEGAVITLGTFHAGSACNVIAGEAEISGTARTLTQKMNLLTQKRMQQVADGIALSYDCQVDLDLDPKGYLPVENNPILAQQMIDFFQQDAEINYVEAAPAMTGEDFGYFVSKIPGAMFWLGVDSPYDLHHDKMNPKEEAIPFGVATLTKFFKYIDEK